MSAYIVDRAHIAYLVHSADSLTRGVFSWFDGEDHQTMSSPAAAGQILWDENVKSVQHRYPGENVGCLPGPGLARYDYGAHQQSAKPVNPVATLKAISCYQYQSCEHPGWATSSAKRFTDTLRLTAIRALPGYDEAAWEVVQ
jgi:hypothetical protein